MPRDRFALDASYNKLHLDTVSGIAFFAGAPFPELVTGLDSVYVSNIHAGSFGAHFGITKRVDLYTGYTITKDTGDGRNAPVPFATTDPIALLLLPVQTYPLTFQSPLARVSVRITQQGAVERGVAVLQLSREVRAVPHQAQLPREHGVHQYSLVFLTTGQAFPACALSPAGE